MQEGIDVGWQGVINFESQKYQCGYCDSPVASNVGYTRDFILHGFITNREYICICHHCNSPTYIDTRKRQFPGVPFGRSVNGINDQFVDNLYTEARMCASVGAYTATAMACRKILMNVAVAKGAEEGLRFVQYVDYLYDSHFLPPGSKNWVDHIRNIGNDANHKTEIISKDNAENLILFTGTLLEIIYAMPAQYEKTQNNTP